MKVKLLLAAAALIVPFATTQAASMPEGNYRTTCTGATVIGSTLKATCERNDGSEVAAELKHIQSCIGSVSNVDGILLCTLPTGPFSSDCEDIIIKNQIIYASCTNKKYQWVETSIKFKGHGHIMRNCDGQLKDRKPRC